jgi:hypothetical protein
MVPVPASPKNEVIMKKLSAMLLGLTLLSGAAFAGNDNAADQKWLSVVSKMVEEGHNQISTPSETRLALVKNWAGSKGFETRVQKVNDGYVITLSKTLAAK